MKGLILLLLAPCLAMSLLVGCGGTSEQGRQANFSNERYVGYWTFDDSDAAIDQLVAARGKQSPGRESVESQLKKLASFALYEFTESEMIGYSDGEPDATAYKVTAEGDSKYNVVLTIPERGEKSLVLIFSDDDHMTREDEKKTNSGGIPMPMVRLPKAEFERRLAAQTPDSP